MPVSIKPSSFWPSKTGGQIKVDLPAPYSFQYHFSTHPHLLHQIFSNIANMGSQKKSKGLSRFFRSASVSNFVKHPLGGNAASASGSQPAQALVEQRPYQAALPPPTISRRRSILNRLGWKSPSPSPRAPPPPEVEPYEKTTNQRIAAPTSSSAGHVFPSASAAQAMGASTSVPTIRVVFEPTASEGFASPSPGTPHSSLTGSDANTAGPPTDPDPIKPPSQSSVVWAKAVEIAGKKLIENNLPPFDLTDLSAQSQKGDMEAVVKSLKALQEDAEEKRWSYTWRGKEIVIVKRLGEILRSVEKYSEVVSAVAQCAPPVGGLVWASIQGIIRVCIYLMPYINPWKLY